MEGRAGVPKASHVTSFAVVHFAYGSGAEKEISFTYLLSVPVRVSVCVGVGGCAWVSGWVDASGVNIHIHDLH